ncbi:hypothetical protein KX729_03385 [Rhizobium sp. XQZ8]|uniref:hypothetical protein n=1 Tax=Rhizobium populisoli TaxID=2859785 RepID=UPI001CA4A283|nr:hypothetical protein [Rhizobium populisoli]MBW6420471.1 hypothetical protein [Rhizobium populisoli]
MTLQPIEALQPGRLAVLYFSQDDAVRCVGYVEKDGLCGWPEKVCGQRPDGWTELTSLLLPGGESAAA